MEVCNCTGCNGYSKRFLNGCSKLTVDHGLCDSGKYSSINETEDEVFNRILSFKRKEVQESVKPKTIIPKDEWIPFTDPQELEPYLDSWFKFRSHSLQVRCVSYNPEAEQVVALSHNGTSATLKNLFEDWKMKVDGEWIPVGKRS